MTAEDFLELHSLTTPGTWSDVCGDAVYSIDAGVAGDLVCQAPVNWEESMKYWDANSAFFLAAHNKVPGILRQLLEDNKICREALQGKRSRIEELESEVSMLRGVFGVSNPARRTDDLFWSKVKA